MAPASSREREKLLRETRPRGIVVVRATERVALIAGDRPGHEHESRTKPRTAGKGHRHAVDPHVWLDPVRAQIQVEAIRAGLAKIDTPNAAAYAANARAYRTRLAALDATFASGLK